VDPSQLLNRPMLERDLGEVAVDPWAAALRRLVAEYRELALPLANGELAYCNLLEGPAQLLTCHPYRLWEYASLFKALGEELRARRFLDVGGAASPLPFLLAEHGAQGLALELQPLLVALSNHVSARRGLDLRAELSGAVAEVGHPEAFDFATCVSVLEHVPAAERPQLLQSVARALKPGGLLYLTFDYGSYVAPSAYPQHAGAGAGLDESLSDLAPLCAALTQAGFAFLGNDPRQLPGELLALKAAPRHLAMARRMALNRRPFDAETPWPEVVRYLGRRLLGVGRRTVTRYARHNFFRLFVTRKE
jgi:SAM-dependent methyltransferase